MPSTSCKLYILTGQIHSGKSSALDDWAEEKIKKGCKVGGLLNPRIQGEKWFKNIKNKDIWPAETPDHPEDELMIGNYIFSIKAFGRARKLLSHVHEQYQYFIIDELGKLELRGNGLEPEISEMIKKADDLKIETLILVVRDYLLDEIIAKFDLKVEKVLSKDELIEL